MNKKELSPERQAKLKSIADQCVDAISKQMMERSEEGWQKFKSESANKLSHISFKPLPKWAESYTYRLLEVGYKAGFLDGTVGTLTDAIDAKRKRDILEKEGLKNA